MPRPHSRNDGLENAPPDIFSRSRRSAEVPNVACTNVAHESCVQWHRPCLAAFLVVALPVLRMSQSHGKRTARALERMEGALLFYDQLSPTLNCRLPLFRSSIYPSPYYSKSPTSLFFISEIRLQVSLFSPHLRIFRIWW